MSGNTFGKLFSVTTAGESHGPALVAIVDGCPPGVELSLEDLQRDLDRRKPGTSRHTTQRQELGFRSKPNKSRVRVGFQKDPALREFPFEKCVYFDCQTCAHHLILV